MKKALAALIASAFIFSGFKKQDVRQLSVVVAANMKNAMDSIITVYEQLNPGDNIQVIYGSSGKLYEQISHGAPFDIFFSADMNYPEKLKEAGYAVSPVKMYAIGKIVLWSKKTDPGTRQMNTLLDASVKKISIANPATAPYGAKAVESMKYYNVYGQVKDKLVYGENIAQAAQFAAFGAADIGIIALSDALSPKMKQVNGKFYILPQESYSPLEQGCVILKQGRNHPVAEKFYAFISSEKAVAILTHFGYGHEER